MKNLYKILAIIFLGSVLSSCFNEVPTIPQYDKTTSPYSIYGNVTFFKIYENITVEVSNEPLGNWDMAFQSALAGDIALVNYTVSARAIKTGTTVFSEVDKNTVNELFQSDLWEFNDPAYSNEIDSTALEDWESKEVYLVYRGSLSLSQEAYYKIQFISKTSDSYTFRYAHVESLEPIEVTINRSGGLANVYYSFETDNVVTHEPNLNEWDFYLAPYFGWFETLTAGEYAPYNVTGVMINNEGGVRVSQVFDETIDYEDIDLVMAESITYSNWKGSIGSTWKNIPPSDGSGGYTMDTAKKYVLKLYDGNYYKLRFLGFYNLEGEQGYPSFEIKLLKQ